MYIYIYIIFICQVSLICSPALARASQSLITSLVDQTLGPVKVSVWPTVRSWGGEKHVAVGCHCCELPHPASHLHIYIYIYIYIHASRISDYMCAIIWHRIVTQWWYYILCFSGEPVLDHSRCHHARNILGIDVRNARHAAIISPDLLIVQNTSAINEWIDMNREIINWNKIKKPVTVVHVRSASIPLLL